MEDRQLTEKDSCPHPKLASWDDLFTRDRCYQCMSCGKEIAIPMATLVEQGEMALRGIVGLAFGEQWEKKVQ